MESKFLLCSLMPRACLQRATGGVSFHAASANLWTSMARPDMSHRKTIQRHPRESVSGRFSFNRLHQGSAQPMPFSGCRPWFVSVDSPPRAAGGTVTPSREKDSPGGGEDSPKKLHKESSPRGPPIEDGTAEKSTAEERPSAESKSAPQPEEQRSEEGEKHSPDEEDSQKPPRLSVTEYNFSSLATLSVRHIVRLVQLNFINRFVFPLAWEWKEFCSGASDAIQTVHELMAAGDFHELKDLMHEELVNELKDLIEQTAKEEEWAEHPELLSAEPVGVFTASAGESEDPEGVQLRVVPLVKITERYSYSGEASPITVKRWQTWGFQQYYSKDGEAFGWKIDEVGKRLYWKKMLPKGLS